MPAIQIRDVPEHIYRRLAEAAKQHRRSLAQQVLETIAKGLDVEVDAKARRRRLIEEIRAGERVQRRLPDAVKLIREDRSR